MQKLYYNLVMIVGFDEYKDKYDFSNVTGVIHVGAHYGQEYDEYQDFFKQPKIHWFEPQKEVFDVLVRNLNSKPNNIFYNFGLGSYECYKQLWNSTNDGQSASFSRPMKHTEIYPHINFEPSEIFKIRTLDSFGIKDSNVLVLDVQGYELEVLKGSIETLKSVDHIFCEINGVEMYEGCPTIDQLNEFLNEHGFQLRENWWTDGNWGDGYWSK